EEDGLCGGGTGRGLEARERKKARRGGADRGRVGQAGGAIVIALPRAAALAPLPPLRGRSGGEARALGGAGAQGAASIHTTTISHGNLSQHSLPLSVTMNVCPMKMPNLPSAVIGLGSAMNTMPGRNTFSKSSPCTPSVKTCGPSVMRSIPCAWIGRDCTPFWRKIFPASWILATGLAGLIAAAICSKAGSVMAPQNRLTMAVGGPRQIGEPICAE